VQLAATAEAPVSLLAALGASPTAAQLAAAGLPESTERAERAERVQRVQRAERDHKSRAAPLKEALAVVAQLQRSFTADMMHITRRFAVLEALAMRKVLHSEQLFTVSWLR
jgi:hypothetical protein